MTAHAYLKLMFCILFSVIISSVCYADTITVGPGGSGAGYDYGTIQEGIDAAINGDTVVIAPGTYAGSSNKNLDFDGKAITVQSINPDAPSVVDATIIDCEHYGRGFYFKSGEGSNSVIYGLTIKYGEVSYGGGILCSNSSPVIMNCKILNNAAEFDDPEAPRGGGIACLNDSHPIVISCIIKNNAATAPYTSNEEEGSSSAWGGGVYCDS